MKFTQTEIYACRNALAFYKSSNPFRKEHSDFLTKLENRFLMELEVPK